MYVHKGLQQACTYIRDYLLICQVETTHAALVENTQGPEGHMGEAGGRGRGCRNLNLYDC